MMYLARIAALSIAVSFLLAIEAAPAVEVTVSGYVADLTGIPHDRPNIRIQVRSVASGNVIATGTSDADGFFSIDIDPSLVPDEDVTLSLTASGTAFINGVETAVRMNGPHFGLAGEIDSKFATRIPDSVARVTHFVVLIVPKAEQQCAGCSNCRPRFFRFRR